MQLSDILLAAILLVLVRREVVASQWFASVRRNWRRKSKVRIRRWWARTARRRLDDIDRGP